MAFWKQKMENKNLCKSKTMISPSEMGASEFPDTEINAVEEKWMTDTKLMVFKFMQLQ